MNNLTDNLNPLQLGNFKVSIDSSEFANIQFFCTVFNLPGISKGPTESRYKGRSANFQGDAPQFDTIELTFIVDEGMKNYEEVLNWLLDNNKYKDMVLSVLSNRNTTNRQIRFKDTFPVSLGSIEFNTQATDTSYASCSATFKYTSFELIK